MNGYFTGALVQMIERVQVLLAKIPTNLPREFHLLARDCGTMLGSYQEELTFLLKDPRMCMPEYQPERLRRFRRIVASVDLVETRGIAALARLDETDLRLNRLIDLVRGEISYPLLPPIVSCLSNDYFCIYRSLNLLCVPLIEGHFLLHLPDLYHELAHPLIDEQYDPKVAPFRQSLSEVMDAASDYLETEIGRESRRRGPEAFPLFMTLWQQAWLTTWAAELFCDLFAIYTLGPAFAWAHLHLCAKRGGNPFGFPPYESLSHPADDARMSAMLIGLRRVGFDAEALEIERKWVEYLKITGASEEPEFRRCYPHTLLEQVAVKARCGVSGMRCRIANPKVNDPVHACLNEAWAQFWGSPETYIEWEKAAVEGLIVKASYGTDAGDVEALGKRMIAG